MDPLVVTALVFAVLALALVVAAVAAFRRRSVLGGATGAVAALLFLALGALCALISVATRGYRAFTREEVAAVVETRPTGEHAFRAVFHLPDSTTRSFELRGDQIYVDARILKWKPVANLLGLHTAYELDRVAGRYTSLERERNGPRTVFPLGEEKPVEMFELLQRLPVLRPLVDARYGSATFLTVDEPARIEVRVSTSGLLMRRDTLPGVGGALESSPQTPP